MAGVQATARTVLHSGVDGDKNHGGRSPDTPMAMAGGDGAGERAHRIAEDPRRWNDAEDCGDRAPATTSHYDRASPEDRGRAGVTEDSGGA